MHIFINIGQAQMGGGQRGAQANLGAKAPLPPPWNRHSCSAGADYPLLPRFRIFGRISGYMAE